MDPDHLPKFEEYNDIYFVTVRVLQDETKQVLIPASNLKRYTAILLTTVTIICIAHTRKKYL